MNRIILPVSIPCSMEVIPRRCSVLEGRTFWRDFTIAVDEVEPSDAPAAFLIQSVKLGDDSYEILRHGGRLWWPLSTANSPMSSDDFVRTARSPAGCFMASLNLSPSTLDAPRTGHQFDPEQFIGRVQADTTEARLDLAQRAAARFMCCGGRMYFQGTEPAYFMVERDNSDASPLDLLVGQLSMKANEPGDAWHPGLIAKSRLAAIKSSRVFGIDQVEAGVREIERMSRRIDRRKRIVALEAHCSERNIVRFCATALGTLVLRNTGGALGLHEELAQMLETARHQGIGPHLLSREILRCALSTVGDGKFEGLFGFSPGRTRKMMEQFDAAFPPPTISPEEFAMLAEAAGV